MFTPTRRRNIKGGIAEQEAAIQISNVMLVCGSCGPTRVGHKFEGDTKVRVCKKCGTTLAAKKSNHATVNGREVNPLRDREKKEMDVWRQS